MTLEGYILLWLIMGWITIILSIAVLWAVGYLTLQGLDHFLEVLHKFKMNQLQQLKEERKIDNNY